MPLPAALNEAFGRYYGAPSGVLGLLLDIARNTPEGRAGRPADAAGVSAGTWNAWVAGARGLPGGRQPSARSVERLRTTSRSNRLRQRGVPTKCYMTGEVEWSSERYRNRTSWRTVRADNLILGDAADAWVRGDVEGMADALDAAVLSRYGDPVYVLDSEHGRQVEAQFRR